MAIRLIVSFITKPGAGSQFVEAYKPRCAEVMQEPGCEQFEVFQSVVNPDRFVLLERWADQAALDAHAEVNKTRAPILPDLRVGGSEREDYEYNARPR